MSWEMFACIYVLGIWMICSASPQITHVQNYLFSPQQIAHAVLRSIILALSSVIYDFWTFFRHLKKATSSGCAVRTRTIEPKVLLASKLRYYVVTPTPPVWWNLLGANILNNFIIINLQMRWKVLQALDFMYYYIRARVTGEKMVLPQAL